MTNKVFVSNWSVCLMGRTVYGENHDICNFVLYVRSIFISLCENKSYTPMSIRANNSMLHTAQKKVLACRCAFWPPEVGQNAKDTAVFQNMTSHGLTILNGRS